MTCGLLVIAGGQKILRPHAARSSLALVRLPVPMLAVRALGAIEVTLGVVAALGPTAVTATLVAVAYASFCGFVLALLMTNPGRNVDCGCFGDGERTAGRLHVALNAIACAVAAASAAAGVHGLGWILGRPPLIAPALIIGAVAAIYAAYVAYTLVPRAWRSYGSGAAR